jgi:CheY-like chemotaxis protein
LFPVERGQNHPVFPVRSEKDTGMALMRHMDDYPTTPWKSCEIGDAPDCDGSGISPLRSHKPRARSVPDHKGCVLLVDDDSAVREILGELLDDGGFHTLLATDAAEALVILRQSEVIDVLVTDLSMPGDDGIALIHQARAIRSDLPAILLTGYGEQMMPVTTIAGGNFHVLCKPVESSRLIQELELLLAQAGT